jgi:TetR/AcrR family transcriptional regulator
MTGTRRSPAPAERQRDAERTRAALLTAAREEFAAKGLAGARVSEIARRAGVNKQLISYYFGGKDGLYDAILQAWYAQEREITDPASTLADTAVRYLTLAQSQPDLQRLFLRLSLDGPADGQSPGAPEPDDDLERMRDRQAAGDLVPGLDPGFALLFVQAMVVSADLFPDDARRLTGLDPTSAEFHIRAREQLHLAVRQLGAGQTGATSTAPDGPS